MNYQWGIDLGGTKIEAAVLDPAGLASARMRIDTEQRGGYQHILRRINLLLDMVEEETGLKRSDRIGLSMPGNIDRVTGLVKNANTVCLIGQPLLADLKGIAGADFVPENDANCFALAEARMGAAVGKQVVFGVILGTGVGGGIVVRDQLLPGHHGIAGEWGHNVLDPNGLPCYCGKSGCVETILSGPSAERYYQSQTGEHKALREIALERDAASVLTIDRLCEQFGKALSVVVNIFDPDAIVVGGGVGNIDRLYSDGRASLERHIFNDRFTGELLQPKLGDSAGVFGACMLTRGADMEG